MSFTLTCFRDLCATYPTWAELSAYVLSEGGGKLRIIEPPNSQLAIIRYTKGVSNFDLEHVRAFRSVVWNKETNRPVSVAPIKAESGDPAADVSLLVSDFVDGTMINAWKSAAGQSVAGQSGEGNSDPQIATRTSLNGNTAFYSTRTFAELFNDALKQVGGTRNFLRSVLADGEFVNFVLQHREHKTVAPIPYNRVFVTGFGRVSEDGTVTIAAGTAAWPQRLLAYAPQVYDENASFSNSKIAHTMLNHNAFQGYTWQGLVFQERDGSRRWRLRNPAYVLVRSLRGSEANPMARFLRLRASGNTKQYLSYFREESNQMWAFEQTLRQRTQELYDAYTAMNKLKTKSMRDLPFCLRPHVYALHGKYLASIPESASAGEQQGPTPVRKETVIDYVNSLAQEDQLKLLEGDQIKVRGIWLNPVTDVVQPAAV